MELKWPPAATGRYEVERSADGVAFEQLGTVLVRSPASSAEYLFVDTKPVTSPVYYRLRHLAGSGAATTSELLRLEPRAADWDVTPNPAADWVSCGEVTGEYRILDATGRMVLSGRLAPKQRVDIRRLRNGHYTFELKSGAERKTRKFLKYAP
ncbi:hypothetical protein GCM10027048_04510 [Hymenobacter coalescens]